MSEAKTGILLRRNEKSYFIKNPPTQGELVFAIDTQELGMLIDGKTLWTPLRGIVNTVAGKQGDVLLNKNDVGLDNVDNTADIDKPVSNAVQHILNTHFNAPNPHKISRKTLNLENVDNTADIDKPISNLTQIELDKKISWEDARRMAGGKTPVFTDTTYSIMDGELSEYNFNGYYKNFIDSFPQNMRVLPAGDALAVDGTLITLFRADGSSQTIETQDTVYDDTEVRGLIKQVDSKFYVVDNLITKDHSASLSANQGAILKQMIDEIKGVIAINDEDFKTLQDIIEYIEQNREKFDDLTIANIKGLQAALDNKVSQGSGPNIAPDSDLLQGKPASDFVEANTFTENLTSIHSNISEINEQIKLFETQTGVNQKITQAINDLNLATTFGTIEQAINRITGRLNEINTDEFESSLDQISGGLTDKIQEIERRFNSLNTELNSKVSEMQTSVSNFDTSEIELTLNGLKEKLQEDADKLKKMIEDAISEVEASISGNTAKIAEKASITLVQETGERISGSVAEVDEKVEALKSEFANASRGFDELNEKIEQVKNTPTNTTPDQLRDRELTPIGIGEEALNEKREKYTGNALTIDTLEYFNSAASANLAILDSSREWVQYDIIRVSSTANIGDLDPEQDIMSDIVISYTDRSSFRFIIGDLKFKKFIARLEAVNINTKNLLFVLDYHPNLYENLDDIKLRIAYDQTFGYYIERQNLSSPNTFQKIITEQEFEDIEPKYNRRYIPGRYEITHNYVRIFLSGIITDYAANFRLAYNDSQTNTTCTLKQGIKEVRLKFFNSEAINDMHTANHGQYINPSVKEDLLNTCKINYKTFRGNADKLEKVLDILGTYALETKEAEDPVVPEPVEPTVGSEDTGVTENAEETRDTENTEEIGVQETTGQESVVQESETPAGEDTPQEQEQTEAVQAEAASASAVEETRQVRDPYVQVSAPVDTRDMLE